jgi:hypothetical protein
VLPNIITCLPLAAAERSARAAAHEAGHAVAALHFELPLKEVEIRDDGTGHTSYRHWLEPHTAEQWTITAFAGAAAEDDLFYRRGDANTRDLLAIELMIRRLGLDWGERRLAALRFDAQRLVQQLRPRILRVAAALVQHRYLTASDAAVYARFP